MNPTNPPSKETFAWKWMRLSAFLLIPLVWFHAILQALITGGHNLSLEYVGNRWAFLGWRAYSLFLLAFAFTHGVNGMRQVLLDFARSPRAHQLVNWGALIFWFVLTLIGAIAIFGGVRN